MIKMRYYRIINFFPPISLKINEIINKNYDITYYHFITILFYFYFFLMNTDYLIFHLIVSIHRDVSIIKWTKIVICQIYICFSLLNGNFLHSFVLLGNVTDYKMIENYNKNILCKICFSSLMEMGNENFLSSLSVLLRQYDNWYYYEKQIKILTKIRYIKNF